jgi:hypothetical protein
MAISTIDSTLIQTAPGRLFLALAPTTLSGATFALKIDELFQKFYVSGDTRKALTADTPWAAITADGFKAKLKQEAVNFEPGDGPPYPVGYQHLLAEAEVTIADLSADKLSEMLSGTAAALLTFAAATGKAGRKTVGLGGEAYPLTYTVMYQYPSKKFPGEFEHVLIPFAVFEVDTDYELSKKAVRQAKLKVSAIGSSLLANPDTGRPVYWIEDRVTAAAS